VCEYSVYASSHLVRNVPVLIGVAVDPAGVQYHFDARGFGEIGGCKSLRPHGELGEGVAAVAV
jgi:hypothetical protein